MPADQSGKCGTCRHLVPFKDTNKLQRRMANIETGRHMPRHGYCTKISLWCANFSRRCGGDHYEPSQSKPDGLIQ